MPERAVVCNTSPLLYLHQIGQLELLHGLYGRVRAPWAVWDELRAGAALGFPVPNVEALSWIHIEPIPDRTLLPAVVDLGIGEAEAIALALSIPESLLVLDDALGRKIAHRSGVAVTGTLGILVRAKEKGLLPSVAPVISDLRQTTMYLAPELIAQVLREAGEV